MLSRLRWWQRRRQEMEGLDAELESHLAIEVQSRIARGETPEDAARAARRAFGNPARIAEDSRAVWGLIWAGQLAQDARYALRQIRRSPALFGAAIALVALGVAANTAIFTFVDAVLLSKLPVPQADSLVQLFEVHPHQPPYWYQRYPLLAKIQKESKTVEGAVGQIEITAPVRHGQTTDRAHLLAVTGDYFSQLGLRALHGRLLTPGDLESVVLTHAYWVRAFGADPKVVGQRIEVWNTAFTVAGVATPEFAGTVVDSAADLWLPFDNSLNLRREPDRHPDQDRAVIAIIARLRPHTSLAQAQAELAVLRDAELDASPSPEQDKVYVKAGKLEVRSIAHGRSPLRDQASTALWFLLGGASILALLVASNVGGLLLARAGSREKEIALRLAIGAPQSRIARMWILESLIVALAGGMLGALLATVAVPALALWLPPARGLDFDPSELRTRSLDLHADASVVLFAIALCCAIALVASLAPALRSAGGGHWTALKAGPNDTWHRRFQAILCGAQIGLCTLLLVFGAWMLRSLNSLRAQDTGLAPGSLAVLTVDPHSAGYKPAPAQTLKRRLMDEIRAIPGVESVALADRALMRGIGLGTFAIFPDRPPEGELNTSTNYVSAEYFQTMGIRLVAGRLFEPGREYGDKPYPVVVNQKFARTFFPGRQALGQQFADGRKWTGPKYQIIGIVADSKYRSLREIPPPIVYQLDRVADGISSPFVLHVKTKGDPSVALSAIRLRIAAVDARLPVYGEATFGQEVERSLWLERLLAGLSSAFGALAVLLTAIGIYGLVSFFVAARRHEIGIRMAVGAEPSHVVALVLGQLRGPVCLGILTGAALATAAARWAASLYYGIQPGDSISVIATVLFLTLAITLSAAPPLRKALQIDPAAALKQDA